MNSTEVKHAADWIGARLATNEPGATMNTTQSIATLPLGTAIEGGFLAAFYTLDDGIRRALIAAPKAEGEHKPTIWIPKYKDVPGAKSWNDGLANTNAMAEAGSKLAQWARSLRIGGFDDWFIPAQDQAEQLYRAFKPTADQNSLFARSGINLSAIEPTRPYTLDFPTQTALEAFQAGGAEAFEADWYWTSTQHAADSGDAWCQDFDDGSQFTYNTNFTLRARAVRSITI